MRLIQITIAAALAVGATGAQAERLLGLTFDNRIVTFNSSNPDLILSSRAVTGLVGGDILTGLDERPANGLLYSMSTSGRLYELVRTGGTYTATTVGLLSVAPQGTAFGFDFNPVPDRLRIISDTGQNLRVNPNNGATIADGMIMSDTGPVQLIAAAYTNSVAGAMSTMLFAIDAVSDRLVRSTNPNAGLYTGFDMMGNLYQPLGFSFTTQNAVGFDISGRTGSAFVNIDSLLWSIDLMTGRGTALGIVGAGPLRSIATTGAIPEPATWAMLILGFGLVGSALRRRQVATVTG